MSFLIYWTNRRGVQKQTRADGPTQEEAVAVFCETFRVKASAISKVEDITKRVNNGFYR